MSQEQEKNMCCIPAWRNEKFTLSGNCLIFSFFTQHPIHRKVLFLSTSTNRQLRIHNARFSSSYVPHILFHFSKHSKPRYICFWRHPPAQTTTALMLLMLLLFETTHKPIPTVVLICLFPNVNCIFPGRDPSHSSAQQSREEQGPNFCIYQLGLPVRHLHILFSCPSLDHGLLHHICADV